MPEPVLCAQASGNEAWGVRPYDQKWHVIEEGRWAHCGERLDTSVIRTPAGLASGDRCRRVGCRDRWS